MKLLTAILFLTLPLAALAEEKPSLEKQCSGIITDKLQAALADTINKSIQLAGDAKDFVVRELPDVIKQLLLWKFYESLVPQVFFFVSFLLFGYALLCAVKRGDLSAGKKVWLGETTDRFYGPTRFKDQEYSTGLPANGYPQAILGGVKGALGLLSLIVALSYFNLDWLKIWLAPKVYLIEYTSTLIHK